MHALWFYGLHVITIHLIHAFSVHSQPYVNCSITSNNKSPWWLRGDSSNIITWIFHHSVNKMWTEHILISSAWELWRTFCSRATLIFTTGQRIKRGVGDILYWTSIDRRGMGHIIELPRSDSLRGKRVFQQALELTLIQFAKTALIINCVLIENMCDTAMFHTNTN